MEGRRAGARAGWGDERGYPRTRAGEGRAEPRPVRASPPPSLPRGSCARGRKRVTGRPGGSAATHGAVPEGGVRRGAGGPVAEASAGPAGPLGLRAGHTPLEPGRAEAGQRPGGTARRDGARAGAERVLEAAEFGSGSGVSLSRCVEGRKSKGSH